MSSSTGVRVPDVDPVHVDVVGAMSPEAGVQCLHHALAMCPAGVRVARAHVQGVLGRENPVLALGGDQFSDDSLAAAVCVVVGGVKEVPAGLAERVDDSRALLLGSAPAPVIAERHCAEAELGYAQARTPEQFVAHSHARIAAAGDRGLL